jgi:hypothetical protein
VNLEPRCFSGRWGYSTKKNYQEARERFNRLRGLLQQGMTPLPATRTAVGPGNDDSEEAQAEADALRDAIAHNGELVWDSNSTSWLADCVKQMREWIPKITAILTERAAVLDRGI